MQYEIGKWARRVAIVRRREPGSESTLSPEERRRTAIELMRDEN